MILGGGFGGVYAAMHLEKIFARDEDVEIILISEQNYLLFTPMIPEVPSSSIEANISLVQFEPFFEKWNFRTAKYTLSISKIEFLIFKGEKK